MIDSCLDSIYLEGGHIIYRRNPRIDNAKGILIILVVIGHFLLPLEGMHTRFVTNLFYLIYTFHMPAFIFISGMMSHGMYIDGEFRLDRFFSTLWLYFIYKTIVFFSEIPAFGFVSPFPDYLHESGSPWYLLALSFWYLSIPFFSRFRKGRRRLPVFLFILFLSLAGGYLDSSCLIQDFLCLDRIIAFSPFFYLGYFLDEYECDSFLSSYIDRAAPLKAKLLSGILYFFGVAVAAAIFTFTLDYLMPYTITVYGAWYSRMASEYFFGLLSNHVWLVRLLWYLAAFLVSFSFFCIMPANWTPFCRIGERTLQIYILHRPIRDLFMATGWITWFDPHSAFRLFLLICLCFIITLFLSNSILGSIFEKLRSFPPIYKSRK